MVVEDNPGPPPAGSHAPGASSQAGITVRVATVPAPVWVDAVVRGRPKWAGTGPGMEEKVHGVEQNIAAPGAGLRGQ